MMRAGRQSFFSAAFAAIHAGALNGVELLSHMFTPRFARGVDDGEAMPVGLRDKVRRRAHNASVSYRMPHHNNGIPHDGARKAERERRHFARDRYSI